MNGRMYDPMVGRFLSADPVLQAPGNFQNYNRYSYVLNNPLKYVDPSGYRTYDYGITYGATSDSDIWGRSGGGGSSVSSVFPLMGTINSPKNNFDYDLQYAMNVDRALGITANTQSVMAAANAGQYDPKDIEGNRLVKHRWVSESNAGKTATIVINGLDVSVDNWDVGISSHKEYYLAQSKGDGNLLDEASKRATEASFLLSAAGYHIGGHMKDVSRFGPIKTLDGHVVANATSKYKYGPIPGKTAVGLGKGLRTGGGILGLATTGYSAYELITDPSLENGANTAFGIVGFFGLPGMAVSGFYSAVKANIEYTQKHPEYCSGGMGMYRWSCFVAGTKVTMSNYSSKNIENIVVGDSILTYNFETKSIEVSQVTELEKPVHDGLIQIEFSDGTKIVNTGAHPYYTKDKGWCSYNPELSYIGFKMRASKLEVGNKCLVIKNKKVRKLEIVSITELEGKEKTYNIIGISNNSNYFVHGILVHNESLVEEEPQNKE